MVKTNTKKIIRSAIVGYGGKFGMGRHHITSMKDTGFFEPIAVCDVDPAARDQAKTDYPEIETYDCVETMLRQADFDLVTVVLPHNLHASIGLKCLRAGKHTILEKPMCLTVREADAMIRASKEAGLTLSVFHCRHWDGDIQAMLEVIEKGLLGEVFHVESFLGNYGHPGTWWRADKTISGGMLYDWGAHFIYSLLCLIPKRIKSVSGFYHKRVWHDVSNEDQTHVTIHFEGGAVGDLQFSNIAHVAKPRWRILGTKGGIEDRGGDGSFTVRTQVAGYPAEMKVNHHGTDWSPFYKNVAAHIMSNEPLVITPERARRVIAVIEYSERSSKVGRPMKLPHE